MPTTNDVIAFVLKGSHARFRAFVSDLKPAEFEAQPIAGMNSVAWMLGHLALTDRRVLGLFGAEVPSLPDGFADKFQTTKQPAGEQTGLGDPAELVALFDKHRELLIAAVAAADADTLAKPLPSPMAGAANVGELAAFMGVHVGLHAGHVSAIRRALGYPPAF